jgi:hypothetical protein
METVCDFMQKKRLYLKHFINVSVLKDLPKMRAPASFFDSAKIARFEKG